MSYKKKFITIPKNTFVHSWQEEIIRAFVATTIRAFVATNQSLLPPFYETRNHPLEQSP